MRVTLTYNIPVVKNVEMTPEEYCKLRASFYYKKGEYFQVYCEDKKIATLDVDSERELLEYLLRK